MSLLNNTSFSLVYFTIKISWTPCKTALKKDIGNMRPDSYSGVFHSTASIGAQGKRLELRKVYQVASAVRFIS